MIIKSNKILFRVLVNYCYTAGGYKLIPYWFDSNKQYDEWFEKEDSDHSIRKIIGIEREEK